MFEWINEKKLLHTNDLIKKINYIIDNNINKLENDVNYNEDENRVITACLYYNSFSNNHNNAINWATFLDQQIEKLYYKSQKEMLARVIEKAITGNLMTLSDRLTTTNLSNNNQQKIFEIIKSWQELSHLIINTKASTEVSNRIQKIQKSFSQQEKLIKKLLK